MRLLTKRIISMVLTLCLCLSMLPAVTMRAEAASPNYTVSSSYKASSYYTALCNVTLTGNQREDIVNVALSQVGYREGSYSGDYGGADDGSYNNYTEYNYWYHNYVSSGMPVGGDSAPWCATFVSWCAEQANIPSSVLRRSTAAGHGASYFNVNFYSGSSTLASNSDNDSYFKGYNYTPQKGDLFFTRSWSHVGLVVGVSGNYVITVEGNTNNNGSSQGDGVYKLTWRKISDLYFGVPNYTNTSIKHTVDTSYGTNFTAYPKAKITAENIFDAYHSQIDSTSWIGTSDKCTIHEVYTDGCCKVTYPLDAGGTKTVYSKISLFNTHTHNYTGTRVYESAHPHRISQRCVDYDTCGGWIWTDEYYEVKTCEQCWHADFDIGATLISINVGESKTVSATVGGCLPDSAVLYRSFSPDNGVVEVNISNQQATFTGIKAGTTNFSLTVYSDSSKSHAIGTITIPVTVTAQTYTVSYNANGGTGAPSDQTKYHGTPLTLSTTKPTRTGYTFLGWATSSTATSATYQPGGSFTSNANTTLYAVWKANTTALSVNSTNNAVVSTGGEMKYYTYTPTTNGKYVIYSTGSDDTKVYLYNASGTELDSDDDDGDGNNFRLEYNLTAGTTYTFGIKYYNSSKTGTISFKFGNVYTVAYNANGGSGAPSAQNKDYGTNITLSSTTPTRAGYTFLGWATGSTATSATYQPGASFTANANTTLYAVWKKGCENNSHSYSYVATKAPTTSATGALTGTCSKCSGTTTVTLPKLNTTDYTYTVAKDPSYTATGIGRYTWNNTTYGTFYFDVTLDKLTATLTKIEVASNPTKTVYEIGESLDTTGLTLKATYSDGSTKTITSGFTTSGFDSATAGEKTVTVTYEGMNTTFTVTVEERKEVDPDAAQIIVSNSTGMAGQQVNVTISLANNPGIASMMLSVDYDTDILTLVGVTDCGNLGTAVHSDNYAACPYTLTWANDLATENYTYNGEIVTLTFEVAEDAELGQTPITVYYDYDNFDIFNVDGEEVWFEMVDGSVSVIDVLIGDVNSDGKVNTQDRMILTRYLAKWTGYTEEMINMTAADVNCDGKVNTQDRMILTRYLAKWTGYEELPYGG